MWQQELPDLEQLRRWDHTCDSARCVLSLRSAFQCSARARFFLLLMHGRHVQTYQPHPQQSSSPSGPCYEFHCFPHTSHCCTDHQGPDRDLAAEAQRCPGPKEPRLRGSDGTFSLGLGPLRPLRDRRVSGRVQGSARVRRPSRRPWTERRWLEPEALEPSRALGWRETPRTC